MASTLEMVSLSVLCLPSTTDSLRTELLPVDGMDEGYERVRQKVDDIEAELHEFLEKYKVSLKCKTLQFRDIGTKDIYQVRLSAPPLPYPY
jgi:hypothetical protein